MIKDYIALDLETTGLRPAQDHILEIGAIRVQNGEITDTFETLVDCGICVPERITELTGITNEMVEEARMQNRLPGTEDAVQALIAFCGDLPILGHNIMFDYSFVKTQAVNHGMTFEKHAIDTLKIARKFLPDLPSRSLEYLCAYYHIGSEEHHRASADAVAAAQLYDRLAAEYEGASPAAFLPAPMQFRPKKQSPATNFQKAYLNDLIKYHKITMDVSVDKLTKSEASRMIDQILSRYGRIKR